MQDRLSHLVSAGWLKPELPPAQVVKAARLDRQLPSPTFEAAFTRP
jgi:hypothetical protein